MDAVERTHLQRLSSLREGPCISVYFPTHATERGSDEDVIRLKNLLRTVERQLAEDGVRGTDARSMLSKASLLPDNTRWWQQRGHGLAIFIAVDFFETYRLPICVPELVTFAHRFRIRPLLPLLHSHQQFYILQLSQNQVLLYSADEQSIDKLPAELPHNLREALNYDGADRGMQVHSGAKAAGGKQAAVFHGQGGQPDAAKDDLLTYCRAVDKAVTARLGNDDRPLLLACVDYLAPIYRKANTYGHLLERTLSGNQDYEETTELHRRALQLVGHTLGDPQLAKAVGRYRDCAGTATTCDDIRDVVTAASEGRIDVLLCDPRASVLGIHPPDNNEVEVTGREDDDDLVDFAAAETLKHGGDVYSMVGQELPTNSPLAAILRY